MPFTQAERSQFERDGYVMKPDIYRPEDLEPVRRAIARFIDRKVLELHAAGELDALHADEPFETRIARISEDAPQAGQKILQALKGKGGGGFHEPEMFHAISHAPLLDLIEELVGPEIIGSGVYRIRPKLPRFAAGEVPWHQDSGYLLAQCDRHLIVTCWLPLVEATAENGCLYVLPGAHREGCCRHFTGGNANFLVIPEAELPQGKEPVCVPVPKGGVLFMTNLTPHASFTNSTDQVRWSLDLRYQSAEVPNNAGASPADYTPERDPVTMACYPPEADFVLRSKQHPERVVRTPEAFAAIRRSFEEQHPTMPGRGWTPVAERT